MSGGLLQLVAYGAQDVYLTGNPQITFFKAVYRRHTNFSIESIGQTFDGTVDFGKRVTLTVERNGDLISSTYLQATLPAIAVPNLEVFAWVESVGEFLIKSVELDIGGQQIDKHYGYWLNIWAALTIPHAKLYGYYAMIGHTKAVEQEITGVATTLEYFLYVPLQFWFCRNPGLALPLIALQYHDIKYIFEFETFANLSSNNTTYTGTASLSNVELYTDYIYLDTAERRRFAQNSHEYLIEQVQFTGVEPIRGLTNNIKLNFNHPVKELIWVFTSDGEKNIYINLVGNDPSPMNKAKLQLNGHDRFTERKAEYFFSVQPYQFHTTTPYYQRPPLFSLNSPLSIHVYSFALKPEEHQPSGTLNFSRIDNATLVVTMDTAWFNDGANTNPLVHIFAPNYNVLRIMSGMGGLAYSN